MSNCHRRSTAVTFAVHTVASAAFAVTLVYGPTTVWAQTALDAYIAKPDSSFSWSIVDSTTRPGQYTRHVVDLTSQTWRTSADVDRTEWRHWLDVIIPDGAPISTAMLLIDGDDNDQSIPRRDADMIRSALATNSVIANLSTVPNQPVRFTGENRSRVEDEIIGYTVDQFLNGGDEEWLLLLPMVKSAVRAMDTVQELVAQQTQEVSTIDDFTVYGVSKRGWTTWLTAAVDARVRAIVPTVYDFLNFEEQLPHHKEFYEGVTDQIVGGYSWTMHDYVDANVIDRLPTPRGREMQEIIDPHSYLDRYENIPKLVINATGDEFSIPDGSRFYFDDLSGQKHLRYVPNSGHRGFFESAVQFHQAITDGVEIPEFNWSIADGGRRIEVTTEVDPLEVKLWQAHNPDARDFRHSISTPPPVWEAALLSEVSDGQYVAEVPYPDSGATAFMIELAFDSGDGTPFLFTTDISVITDGPVAQLLAGDADQDLDFDQLDLVKVQVASKYLTGQTATWGEGDWNGAPGGSPANPPAGDGMFNQFDIIAANVAGVYLQGPYAAIQTGGTTGDGQTSLVYNANTGELSLDPPADQELTSINVTSAGGRFLGDKPDVLDGAFDNFAADNLFKATFGGSFGSISFGTVLPVGVAESDLAADLSVVGSLAGGGDLGNVDLVYVPEPTSVLLLTIGLVIALSHCRRKTCRL